MHQNSKCDWGFRLRLISGYTSLGKGESIIFFCHLKILGYFRWPAIDLNVLNMEVSMQCTKVGVELITYLCEIA